MSTTDGNNRRRKQPTQFRSIDLSPEMVAMGVTDIKLQAKNMTLRFTPLQNNQQGLMVIARYDPNDLRKTQKSIESQLAEYVGKPRGLPSNFDPNRFAGLLVIALYQDAEDQFMRAQEQLQQETMRIDSMIEEIRDLKEANENITVEEWRKTLVSKYDNLKKTVNTKLPKVWPGLEFGLSNLRVLNLDDCDLPLIGILLGRPGSGKTVDITLLSKWVYGYYTDNFSAKSWVTHTTSAGSEEALRAIDMLPRIKDHQFLTPELATLFNLKEDDLRVALSMITRIADGHGWFSDSGVYGHRGYSDIMFVWLGAVVDIPHHVYKVMSNLGPRLYFFRLPFKDVTAEDAYRYLTDKENFRAKYKAIEEVLIEYLKWFEIGPTLLPRTPRSPHLRKMEWDTDKNDLNAVRCISQLAYLLGYLRREGRAFTPKEARISDEDNEDEPRFSYFTGEMEDIIRASTILLNLARGHAAITGRNHITMEDVPIVVKTVLSTARVERVKTFIALLDHGGWITRKDLADQLNVSRSTAYRYMTELGAIGLADVEHTDSDEVAEDDNKYGHPAKVKIMRLKKNRFDWFLTYEFEGLRESFTPVDNKNYIGQEDPEKSAVKAAADIPEEGKKN